MAEGVKKVRFLYYPCKGPHCILSTWQEKQEKYHFKKYIYIQFEFVISTKSDWTLLFVMQVGTSLFSVHHTEVPAKLEIKDELSKRRMVPKLRIYCLFFFGFFFLTSLALDRHT